MKGKGKVKIAVDSSQESSRSSIITGGGNNQNMTKARILSVRISDGEALDQFIKYAKTYSGVTQAQVIENLLRYFNAQSLEQKHLLARGVGIGYLDLLGEALQLVTWGDHAHQGYKASSGNRVTRGSFLPWMIGTYNQLDKLAADAQQPEKKGSESGKKGRGKKSDKDGEMTVPKDMAGILSLRRVAWFKLGTAWLYVAKELRAQALVELADLAPPGRAVPGNNAKPSDWNMLYDAAIDSLHVANAHFYLISKSLEKPDEPKSKGPRSKYPPALYNQACMWSLIAKYTVERDAENSKLESLAKALRKEEAEKLKKMGEPTAEQCLQTSGISKAESALRKANEYLQEIPIVNQGESEGPPFADAQWLINYAEYDPDIACFRDGADTKNDFNSWREKRASRLSLYLYNSYIHLRSGVSDDVKDALESENLAT